MNWIEHMEAAASQFHEESEMFFNLEKFDLAIAAGKDAKAIEQLIEDIENGRTQEK